MKDENDVEELFVRDENDRHVLAAVSWNGSLTVYDPAYALAHLAEVVTWLDVAANATRNLSEELRDAVTKAAAKETP